MQQMIVVEVVILDFGNYSDSEIDLGHNLAFLEVAYHFDRVAYIEAHLEIVEVVVVTEFDIGELVILDMIVDLTLWDNFGKDKPPIDFS